MDAINLLNEPLKWEFKGNEKEFESYIIDNLDDIVDCLGLSKVAEVHRQKQFRFPSGQIIVDILIVHKDRTLTVFEVKKPNENNNWTSPHAQMQAVGQLLLYKTIIKEAFAEPRLVLIDNKIHSRTVLAFTEGRLPITLVELQNDRLFIPFRAF